MTPPEQALRGAIDAAALRVAQSKALTLVEALPWLERFRGALVVVKYGGNAMVDDSLKAAFAQDIVFLRLRRACDRSSCTAAARRSRACSTGSA